MLTADLIRVQKKSGELRLPPLDAPRRARAEAIASAYLAVFEGHLGRTRDELEESLDAIEVDPRDRLVAKGLAKLLEDRAELDVESPLDPVTVRERVFRAAAERRRTLPDDGAFERAAVLADVAGELGTDPAAVELALYADLKGAALLKSFAPLSPAALVEAYDTGRAQAVLLRAVRVRVDVVCAAPAAYRALFARLKFHRLLYRIERRAEGGFRLELDGPMSLFESVTKYGLELASLLPVLRGLDLFELEADVRWEPGAPTLLFRTKGGLAQGEGGGGPSAADAGLGDELGTLLERLRAAAGEAWTIEVADELLELPGVGLVVPDLVFARSRPKAPRVFLEVMGHWSRSAVWRRVELVEQGLSAPVVFAVSTRLRVSEEALPEGAPSALYVYKGAISAKAVLEKVTALADARPTRRPR